MFSLKVTLTKTSNLSNTLRSFTNNHSKVYGLYASILERPRSFLSNLYWRRSVKHFKPCHYDDVSVKEIVTAINQTPSSSGVQLYKVLVIKDSNIKKLLKANSNNEQISESSHLFVFCVMTNVIPPIKEFCKFYGYDETTTNKRIKIITEKPDLEHWITNQLYISLGFALAACAEQEIPSCPMEGFDKDIFNQVLDLKNKELKPICLLAVGKPHENDAIAIPFKRYRSENVVVEL